MPLCSDVVSLEELAKKEIHEILVLNEESIKEKAFKWRMFFIEHLPGSLRTDLLCYGFSKYDSKISRFIYPLSYWVPFSVALFDRTIKYVPPIYINDLEKDLPLLMSFVSYLWTYRPKINKLFMNLLYVHKKRSRWNVCMNSIQCSMNILCKCLEEGLSSNLVQLQLTYQCDDSILTAIGRNSKCLKMLDVSCSSTITTDGIKSFLFKELNTFENDLLNGSETQVYAFLRCIVENREILNTVCFTLEEIRLQCNKDNNIGWIFILSCIQSLRHLGWPGKWNIKKIIITVWNEIIKPKKFNLESITLIDWDITCDEINTMSECLPHLRNLNTTLTRSYEPLNNINHQLLMEFWNKLNSLTLYMDNTIEYFQFFCRNGYIKNLSELTIKSVSLDISFNLALLQSGCPNLIILDIVSVSLYINLKPTGKFEYLKTVKMTAPFEETKTWFLFHGCPSLEELQIFNEMDPQYWKNIFITPPPIICQQMKRLEIEFGLPNGNPTFLIHPCIMNSSIVTEFIRKCSVLNTFGSISNFGMTTQDVENVHNFIRLHNYSMTIY
ncbi:uncharacterized protein LOC100576013 [Acyrthosiphon pisum]|uniref:Uncharacterized protein n=1 Tax=Acyrthosiphon pisum TaxID=7029 RepID=A0A8R1WA51_ACYPI|nr:uncharacterized protein LOC100576013 [Acyrthosiphon pisum]|eukprot:XP_003247654.1 PREDICTED: uncharacterized protein LOC100576013 [Acyrthosiphon pisum]